MRCHCDVSTLTSGLSEVGCRLHAVSGITVIGTVELADGRNEGDARRCATGAHAFLDDLQTKVQPDGGQGWPSGLDAQTCVANAASSDPGGASLAGLLEVKGGKRLGVAVVVLNGRYGPSPNSSMLIESDSTTDFSCDVDADKTLNLLLSIDREIWLPLLKNNKIERSAILASSDTVNFSPADHIRQSHCRGLSPKQGTAAAAQRPANDYQEACR